MNTVVAPKNFFSLDSSALPEPESKQFNVDEKIDLKQRIKALLKEKNAKLVAHYYVDAELQRLADETGGYVSDSLDMARFGTKSDATLLLVCGVRFMGETAKILNPEKTVLMPELDANCSLDLGCPSEKFSAFCDQHPDRTVIVYANTSAAVKARADWMVTSSSALEVVRHLMDQNKKFIWAPDRFLGQYIINETGADMLLWQSSCIVHEEFKAQELQETMQHYPTAKVLVHPESPASVIALADLVGSTSAIIKAASQMDADTFIVATDKGIFHKMQEAAPNKLFIEAPTAGKSATCKSCAQCPWMAMNGLRSTLRALEHMDTEIHVDKQIINRARQPIKRLLDFAEQKQQTIYGNHDA